MYVMSSLFTCPVVWFNCSRFTCMCAASPQTIRSMYCPPLISAHPGSVVYGNGGSHQLLPNTIPGGETIGSCSNNGRKANFNSEYHNHKSHQPSASPSDFSREDHWSEQLPRTLGTQPFTPTPEQSFTTTLSQYDPTGMQESASNITRYLNSETRPSTQVSSRLPSTSSSLSHVSSRNRDSTYFDSDSELNQPPHPNAHATISTLSQFPEDNKSAGRQRNFTNTELEQLCKSWLHVSQDAIVGKDRRGLTFWKSIAQDFNKRLKTKVSPTPPRSPKSLEAHWSTMNRSMCKYAACVQQIKRLEQSGKAPADLVEDSIALYKSDTGCEFKDMVCYKLLRNAPKWQDNPTFLDICTPTTSVDEPNITDQTPDFAGNSNKPVALSSLPVMDRPMGNKKAKRGKFIQPESVSPQILANSTAVATAAARLVVEQSLQRATLQRMLEHSILMSNTAGLDEQSQTDILAEKASIIAKNRARREEAEE